MSQHHSLVDLGNVLGYTAKFTIVPNSFSDKEFIADNVKFETKTVIDGHSAGGLAGAAVGGLVVGRGRQQSFLKPKVDLCRPSIRNTTRPGHCLELVSVPDSWISSSENHSKTAWRSTVEYTVQSVENVSLLKGKTCYAK